MKKWCLVILTVVLAGGALVAWWHREDSPETTAAVLDDQSAIESEKPVACVQPDEKQTVGPAETAGENVIAAIEGASGSSKGAAGFEPDEGELHSAIRLALEGETYKARHQAITFDVPDSIGAADYKALKAYLLVSQDGKDGDFRQHEYALRNNMMDALRMDESRLGETIETLVGVYADAGQGDVMRGYALQHLMLVYIDHVPGLSGSQKSRILRTFENALADTEGLTVPSTALVGMQEASRRDPGTVPPSTVARTAMHFLESDAAGTLSKISALQICGELKHEAAASHARAVAFDPSADWVLRMSGVYALGQLGDTAGLEALLSDSDGKVRKAVMAALNAKR